MTPELTALTLAALLQITQIALYSSIARRQVGNKAAFKPRDEPIILTGIAGRAQRAMNNHFEGLLLFAIAALIVTLSDQSTPLTAFCAGLYVAARVIYIPAYLFGWVPWRSFIWSISILASTLMLISALL